MAHEVEHVELAVAVARGDALGVLGEPADALRRAMLRPRGPGRLGVDLVLRQVGVDLADDDAVVLERALDRDVAVGDVLAARSRDRARADRRSRRRPPTGA